MPTWRLVSGAKRGTPCEPGTRSTRWWTGSSMRSAGPTRAGLGDRMVTRQSTTLMLNTAATFVRMAVTVWMGLVTARLLLAALGADGFGGYAMLFAAASLSALVGDSLWNSTMTRLALELGRGERGQLREVFNTALAAL